MEGKPINGRSVRVGDYIMNEWTGKRMVVEGITEYWENRRRQISLHCTRDDGKREVLSGRYWTSKTWLISRGAK